MQFSMLFSAVSALIAASVVGAVPGGVTIQEVYVPPVTSPSGNDVWKVGSRQTVTWDVSRPPKTITNSIGTIMLRKANLTTPVILADGFKILNGKQVVTVPWVVDGDDYQVVLFGDSGNNSPVFTIKK
ncbi:hypothetical protein H0H81_002471 [Sphagnurus paluster]|uniref:Yeast cell wall synthesis Kre9/Knh1-like N-terminal domain-containing protein n=1 Tax=Sphagnurus paluster TaxID=117069 RepID=A0A9P7K3X8_9AGAR|nr:hypothetical protein H0H81_002471 [Sphagnurus paluster]